MYSNNFVRDFQVKKMEYPDKGRYVVSKEVQKYCKSKIVI